MSGRRRALDAELVRRGLAPDREAARSAIAAGDVLVGGAPATNPGRQVDPGDAVALVPPRPRYLSRAGEKLHAALDRFGLVVADRLALDVGSSTGGFTSCLLAHGARHVVAVDVGRAQLHESLLADPRVTSRERTDVRSVAPLAEAPTIVTVDVSFTSLRTVLPAVLALAAPGADLVALVKPQFEAPKEVVDRGRGIVRDPDAWAAALTGVAAALGAAGAAIMAAMPSPLRGRDGNLEFLLHARAPGPGVPPSVLDADALVALAHEQGEA
ncbi:TlyA family RNA methyltransferase [Iamia sp. SCSIO 61187]|uniref:TlyA family RNA methyltransferase n=1 Tax=Iamia sp. SCSIO 61187 TaxID=2722752 RepID=UPI001C62A9A5|nr:TlyA family RNA methyltransferase [Iamia sp. SCSIO 61187]QYG92828.1 TlyA family RNA methyltransferase [Iamia sp. SCSIO 61187]